MRAKEGKTFTIIDSSTIYGTGTCTTVVTGTCTTVVINTTYDNTCQRKRRRTFSDAKLSCAHTCTSKNATIIQGYTNN